MSSEAKVFSLVAVLLFLTVSGIIYSCSEADNKYAECLKVSADTGSDPCWCSELLWDGGMGRYDCSERCVESKWKTVK